MWFRSTFTIPAVTAIGFLLIGGTVPAAAQQAGPFCPGGLTDIVDLQAQTGNNLHLGIQYVESLDIYWSSARGIGGPHQLYSFDNAGALTGAVAQITAANTSVWGYRDMASDGKFIYAGWEDGVARHNLDGSGGTQIIFSGPPGDLITWRAMAYDPTGDGGAGSLWIGDFAAGLIETSMTGVLLKSFPNISGWSLYGLAYDPTTGNLWGYSSPTEGNVVEIDIQDGSPTEGRETGLFYFPGCIPGSDGPGGNCQVQGGLTMVPGGAFEFRGIDPFNLVLLGQGTSDSILGIRIEPCGSDCPADFDNSGDVGVKDLLFLLGAWGPCPEKGTCPADFDNSGDVGVKDLLFLLGVWGPCAGPCGPDSGSCFSANGTPGCSNEACCNAVCEIDPLCCDVEWDETCATLAVKLCSGCGNELAGDCFEAHGTPFCDDAKCCELVCKFDPFCCKNEWDALCARLAKEVCGP